jgi:hypothetical protein
VSVNGSFIEVTSNTTAAVEADPETYRWRQETGDGSVSVYAPADGRPYVRTQAGNTIRYDRPENESLPDAGGLVTPPLSDLAGAFNFSANGTAEVDGTRTYVYEANASTLNDSAVGPIGEALAEAESTDATIEV